MTGSHPTVLLVEDNPSDGVLLQRTLRKASLAVPITSVSSGEAALDFLKTHNPSPDRSERFLTGLVFLDLKLPGMSGFEVLSWIRQQPRFKRLHVVVLTVSRHTLDIYRAYELGASSYLVKPVSVSAFTEMAQTLKLDWLVHASESNPLSTPSEPPPAPS